MKPLLKIMLTMALIFLTVFAILHFTGVLTIDKITTWLEAAKGKSISYVFLIIVILLFSDLFLSVPTLSVMLLAGYLIGAPLATLSSSLGLLLAGLVGYWISAKYGNQLLKILEKNPVKRQQAIETFREHGTTVILLSRALPMLPEISACLAGMTGMPLCKFLTLWLLSIVPYACIATYAGSISTLDNPTPAILAATGLITCLWLGWFLFKKKAKTALK